MQRLERMKSHHYFGLISMGVGLSFLLEQYSLVSAALASPFLLMDLLPISLSGQRVWGLMFTIGGALVLVRWNIYLRVVTLVLGMTSWAIFTVPALHGAWVGERAEGTGAFAGILSLAMTVLALGAITSLRRDFNGRVQK